MLHLVTVERVQCCDYLIHLIDDYSRSRVAYFEQYGAGCDLTVEDWSQRQPHFKQLQDVKFDLCAENIRINAAKVAKRYVLSLRQSLY